MVVHLPWSRTWLRWGYGWWHYWSGEGDLGGLGASTGERDGTGEDEFEVELSIPEGMITVLICKTEMLCVCAELRA